MALRADIMAAVKTRFEGILVTGGYHTDLGENVFIGKTTAWSDEETPGVNLLDTRDDIDFEGLSGPANVWTRRLSIEAQLSESGATSLVTLRQMIADVYKAIGVDLTWGGRALDTNPDHDEIEVDQEEQTIAGATVYFTVVYRTAIFAET